MLNFQGKLLNRPREICGGWEVLSSKLGVSEHTVRLWHEGKARLPENVFLQAADIVLEDDIARAEHDRRKGPRVAAIHGSPERSGAGDLGR